MKKLKVKFVDFWVDMDKPEGNFFYDLLARKYDVEFSDDPELVFYSCYGSEYLKYKCTRIFYCAENKRPDFSRCDYAMTFDYLADERHLRLPLWALYYRKDWIYQEDPDKRFEDWANRKHFCCIIVSNATAVERVEFYRKLNARRTVDSAGQWNNTIGTTLLPGTENKLQFIRDYRFVISFENSSNPGYATEKIIEPLMAGCIPIYWGDPEIHLDFNMGRVIAVRNSEDYDAVIDRIVDMENDKSLAKSLLSGPIFPDDKLPVYLEDDYISKKLFEWIGRSEKRKFRGVGSEIRSRVRYYSAICKSGLITIKNKIVQ